MSNDVLVVIGAGGIGQAIARRTGPGKQVLLADFNDTTLEAAATALQDAGHTVTTRRVDVSDRTSVHELAQAAADLGDVVQVVNTAGLSPVQASPPAILAVDLYGTALVLEEFGAVIAPGGAGVHISSMAGHMPPPLDPQRAHALAATPTDDLLALPMLGPAAVPSSGAAYSISKQANHLRVQAAALTWGERGARVNSTAPASSSPRSPATRCPDPAPRATAR
jgi:NAD(P)-dependent dehydrogenase (short-subunit alcohol dehydrogenase family)